jgi:hypothetical protein
LDLEAAIHVQNSDAWIDPELRRRGDAHLQAVRARSPSMYDGPVLVLDRIEGDVVHAVRGNYFDMVATCDSLSIHPELRAYAEQLAAPDPLRNGHGRAAAIGVTVVVVHEDRFTLGRRAPDLALEPGRWHVVGSGVVDAGGLVGTIAAELAEEHGIEELPEMRILGLDFDYGRLRPELTVMTEDIGYIAPLQPGDEFTEFRDVHLEPDALAQLAGLELTPAAQGAVAALQRELQG